MFKLLAECLVSLNLQQVVESDSDKTLAENLRSVFFMFLKRNPKILSNFIIKECLNYKIPRKWLYLCNINSSWSRTTKYRAYVLYLNYTSLLHYMQFTLAFFCLKIIWGEILSLEKLCLMLWCFCTFTEIKCANE